MSEYIRKYLKYKRKYIELKKGGYRNCPELALNLQNHPVVNGELIDMAYDGWKYNGIILENRCTICRHFFANEKISRCCHRVCTTCRINWKRTGHITCPLCRNDINEVFRMNDERTEWILVNDDDDTDMIEAPPFAEAPPFVEELPPIEEPPFVEAPVFVRLPRFGLDRPRAVDPILSYPIPYTGNISYLSEVEIQQNIEVVKHHNARDLRLYRAQIEGNDIRDLILEENRILRTVQNPGEIPVHIRHRQEEELENYHTYNRYKEYLYQQLYNHLRINRPRMSADIINSIINHIYNDIKYPRDLNQLINRSNGY